jgi:hypothetical protein
MTLKYYTHQNQNTQTEMQETPNFDTFHKSLLRVVALGNLSIYLISEHQFITHHVFSRYLTIIIILTELIIVANSYSNIVIQRRHQPNLRQWPVSTSLMRGPHSYMVYHIYLMNVLLLIILFCQWCEYTNYFCGICYSGLILLTL